MRGIELADLRPGGAGLVRAAVVTGEEVPRLSTLLRAGRSRAFVGRESELALFRTALGDVSRCVVLYLHGTAGVGKSTVLRRCAAEAEAVGRVVLRMDRCDPAEVVAAVLAAQPLIPAGASAPVLLFDDLEQWRAAEVWLREDFFPGLPLGTVVVLAGRRAPDVAWTADPGWRDVLRIREVVEFDAAETGEWLDHEAVPAARRPLLCELSGGHPLLLSLAAAAVAAGETDDEVRLGTSRAVIRRLLEDLPTPEHRRAVELCAYADPATERMLHAAVPQADPVVLLHWLLDQPWTVGDDAGVCLRPYLRRALRTELRWRDPVREDSLRDLVCRSGAARPLTRARFDAAVGDALREYRRPDRLAGNPLAQSRMVVAAADHADPGQALQAVLRAAVDAMGEDPRESKAHRALVSTYLGTAPTQDAAAQRLGLPFSTYRRHLTRGVRVLADLLWRRELT